MCRDCCKLVWVRLEWQVRKLCDLCRSTLAKLRMRIQTSAHSRSTDRKIEQTGHCQFHSFDIAREQAGPTTHFLIDCERRCVLKMRAADFNHSGKLFCLCLDRVVEFLDLRYEFVQLLRGGNVHRS